MNVATLPRSGALVARSLGALLLLVAYIYSYFPFASGVSRRIWEGHRGGLLLAVLILMGLTLLICKFLVKPRSRLGWVCFWLCLASWVASLLGVILISLPQRGHPSIGIFFFLTPLGVNSFIVPTGLVLFLIGLIRGEKLAISIGGFLFLLVASFFFSSLRFSVPLVLDSVSGTKWFSKIARRKDVDFTDIELPNSNEMANDIELIRKGRLTEWKLNQIDTTASYAPHHRCRIIKELVGQFPTAKEFELQRRVLMEIGLQCQWVYLRGEKCDVNLIPFYFEIMEKRNADVSDMAADYLASHFFDQILSEDRYQNIASAVAKYAMERQLNPQPYPTNFAVKFYSQRTFDCAPALKAATSNLLQRAEISSSDRKAVTNLTLFLPYLEARLADTGEPSQEYVQRICNEVISKIEQLQGR